LKVGVGIATKGRPDELADIVAALARQTMPPDMIVVSAVSPSDVGALVPSERLKIVFGSAGLCHQRNRALDPLLPDSDIVAFFDDDYLPSRFALERMAAVFHDHPDIVGLTGALLADGINSLGISRADAEAAIARYDSEPVGPVTFTGPLVGLYGCNMVFRGSVIGDLRFDEALPAYAWQEDIDFSARIGRKGMLCKTSAFAGIHRGVKGARQSGIKFGYSQIANPVYLMRKGTMPFAFGVRLMLKNMLANHGKLVWPEPWVDRRGRVRGNWLGLRDLVRGSLSPGRIAAL
jgi:GT2 family glycosyltransferase